MILATDGEDTHSVFLYECDEQFFFSSLFQDFVGNYTSTGHRLGDTHDNYTCVNNDIKRLLLCEFVACFGYFESLDFHFYAVSSYFRNLTKGCKSVCL